MILLDNKALKDIFADIAKNPDANEPKERLINSLNKVVKCTIERYPLNLREDLSQELLMVILKKANYLADLYNKGEIKDLTGYVFRLLHNAAINCSEKERSHNTRFVSLEDIKVDKAYFPNSYQKYKVVDRIKEEVTDYVLARFVSKRDSGRAIKYIDCILEGKRPSFKNETVQKWYSGKYLTAKEAYSIVFNEIKRRLLKYRDELVSKRPLE